MMELQTEIALLDWFYEEGITVREARLPATTWGLYDLGERTVYLQRGMPEAYRVPVLAHEAHHVRRADRGHQEPRVERFIDEAVAVALIDLQDYRDAESHYGASTMGVAADLGVPVWLVRAYRRVLGKTVRIESALEHDQCLA